MKNSTGAEKIDTQIYYGIEGCVFKVYYGEKYIVSMGKYLKNALDMLNTDLRGVEINRKSLTSANALDKAMFYRFAKYVANNPGNEFKVELLFQSDSPYKLLVRCQQELDDSIADDNCLNTYFTPFISKRIQTPPIYFKEDKYFARHKQKYWINRGHYLNYRKWLYSRYVI